MKSFRRIMIILSCSILLIGIILVTVGLLFGGTTSFMINEHGIYTSKDFHVYKQDKIKLGKLKKIDISSLNSTIEVLESDDYYIEYSYLSTNNKPCHQVVNGILKYKDPKRKNFFNFSSDDTRDEDCYIKLYIPKGANLDSFVVDSSSDIDVSNFSTKTFDIDSSYGDVTIKNINANKSIIDLSSGQSNISNFNTDSLSYSNSYGNAEFTSFNKSKEKNTNNKVYIDMSSGNATLNEFKTDSLEINNSYGDISLKNVTTNKLIVDLSSGSLDSNNSKLGDITIDNSYGDVILTMLDNLSNYDYDLSCDYGTIKVNNTEYKEEVKSDNNRKHSINIDVSSGDIDLSFLE